MDISERGLPVRAFLAILLSILPCYATNGQPVLLPQEQAWLSEHPIIRVAPDPYFPPIEWIDSSEAFQGIAADYTRLVEKMLGVKFQIVQCATWDEVLTKAKNRDVDMLFAAAQTPNRRGADLKGMISDIGQHPERHEANENMRKDGSRVWISWKNKPIYTLDGEFSTMLCVGNDITRLKQAVAALEEANKRADESLAEAQKRYRFLFEESPAGSPILSADGTMTDISRSLAQSLGYAREEVVGKQASFFVVEDDRQEQAARLQRRFRDQQTEQVEVRVGAKDGTVRTILFSAGQAALRDPGKPESVLVTGIDITDRKNAEHLARQREQELVRADKLSSLGTLVSGVAHEINNPNNFIILNAGNIRDVWASATPVLDAAHKAGEQFDLAGIEYAEAREDVPRLIQGIIDGAERIRVIVGNLKDFARPESPAMDQMVDLNKVVEASRVILSNMIKKATDRFEVLMADPAPLCRGNFQKLEQVVINLISNACQALPERSRAIRVSTQALAGQVCLEVVDDGMGIAAEHMARMFDPFYTTKRDSGGTGLGLSISYSIVKEHGGELTLTSSPAPRSTSESTIRTSRRQGRTRGSRACPRRSGS